MSEICLGVIANRCTFEDIKAAFGEEMNECPNPAEFSGKVSDAGPGGPRTGSRGGSTNLCQAFLKSPAQEFRDQLFCPDENQEDNLKFRGVFGSGCGPTEQPDPLEEGGCEDSSIIVEMPSGSSGSGSGISSNWMKVDGNVIVIGWCNPTYCDPIGEIHATVERLR